jgi:hypothetical protein
MQDEHRRLAVGEYLSFALLLLTLLIASAASHLSAVGP